MVNHDVASCLGWLSGTVNRGGAYPAARRHYRRVRRRCGSSPPPLTLQTQSPTFPDAGIASTILGMIAYCLADVFNLRLWPPGRRPNAADIRDGIAELVDEALTSAPDTRELTMRLYGGWHGLTSQSATDLLRMVRTAIRQLPKVSGRHRLRVQIADHPIWDSSIRILRSARELPLARVRAKLSTPDTCTHADQCTFPTFRSWSRGRCPTLGCTVRLGDLASVSREKMVDTLLTADAITIISDQLADVVIVASDDDDMLPALLALAVSDIALIHLRRQDRGSAHLADYYGQILRREGATIRTW